MNCTNEEKSNSQWVVVYQSQLICRLTTSLSSSLLCCIADGMDQSKFRCPKVKGRPSKALEALYGPTLHCSGFWIHGHQLRFSICNEDVRKDSTTQLELLFLALSSLREHHSKLPLVLHLQQDNCFREGKNQFVAAAMILLVILRVFKATACGFLRTGHSAFDWFLKFWGLDFSHSRLKGIVDRCTIGEAMRILIRLLGPYQHSWLWVSLILQNDWLTSSMVVLASV